ncbi:hypothetical protein Fmac_026726 [Flemingia macrophylla]|uniref:Uncharacterized protein n=1 Tax=Flemingia macrophylla TaxID=520843 RepID=A0ABD1LFM7_9FABA
MVGSNGESCCEVQVAATRKTMEERELGGRWQRMREEAEEMVGSKGEIGEEGEMGCLASPTTTAWPKFDEPLWSAWSKDSRGRGRSFASRSKEYTISMATTEGCLVASTEGHHRGVRGIGLCDCVWNWFVGLVYGLVYGSIYHILAMAAPEVPWAFLKALSEPPCIASPRADIPSHMKPAAYVHPPVGKQESPKVKAGTSGIAFHTQASRSYTPRDEGPLQHGNNKEDVSVFEDDSDASNTLVRTNMEGNLEDSTNEHVQPEPPPLMTSSRGKGVAYTVEPVLDQQVQADL